MTPEVKVGQVWADNDKRAEGRKVRVVAVDTTHATVELIDLRGRAALRKPDERAEPGRQTRIRLDRFKPTSTGYRLDTDAPDGAA